MISASDRIFTIMAKPSNAARQAQILQTWVPPVWKAEFEALCAKKGRTVSWMLRHLVGRSIKRTDLPDFRSPKNVATTCTQPSLTSPSTPAPSGV